MTTGFTLPRVNLLPPEVHQARKLRRLQVGLGAGLAALVVVLGAAYLVEDQSSHQAADDVASVQAQSTSLNAQKAQYADVPQTLSAIDAAETARQTAMTNDIAWYRYLNDLSYVTPANTWLTQLNVTMAGAAGATPAGAAPVTATASSTPSIATITFAGYGEEPQRRRLVAGRHRQGEGLDERLLHQLHGRVHRYDAHRDLRLVGVGQQRCPLAPLRQEGRLTCRRADGG